MSVGTDLPEFQDLKENQISNIFYYPYKNLRTLLNTPRNSPRYLWHKANLQGEIYEYLIYEKLLSWVITSEYVTEFILKGPYIKRVASSRNGLTYDSKNQIYYMSSGETIGEFDALLKYGKYRIFVEIKKMGIPSTVGKLKYDIERKYNLLKILFPNEEIGCWIIAPAQKNIDPAIFPNIKGIQTPQYKLDPYILKLEDKKNQIEPPNSIRLITAYQCVYNRFNYFAALLNIHKRMNIQKTQDLNVTINEILTPYTGLIERIFLGKLSVAEFNKLLQKNDWKLLDTSMNIQTIYPAIKFKGSSSLSNTFYLKESNKRYYEMVDLKNGDIKAIQRGKRAPRDINYLDRYLNHMNVEQVEQYLRI